MQLLKTISHTDITDDDLLEAIYIKKKSWPYPLERQKEWISKNIDNNDVHCFLKEENKTLAYLNLVDESIELDGIEYKIWGIGNVCSGIKGQGYGGKLITEVNKYIINSNRIGILYCHDELINFYFKYDWRVMDDKLLYPLVNGIHIMIFNSKINFNQLIYRGKNF